MSEAVVFFADGLEECEGMIVVDILRRGGVKVTVASISGNLTVHTSHGMTVLADELADNVDFARADMIVLPGGYKGTLNLAASRKVADVARAFASDPKKYIAAICAAPSVLGDLGLLKGHRATCYPGWEDHLQGAQVTHEALTEDGHVITANGLGAAIPFALRLLKILEGKDVSEKIRQGIQYPYEA